MRETTRRRRWGRKCSLGLIPLAGPRVGAEVAPQGKAGIFHKTAKLGDFSVHRPWGWRGEGGRDDSRGP